MAGFTIDILKLFEWIKYFTVVLICKNHYSTAVTIRAKYDSDHFVHLKKVPDRRVKRIQITKNEILCCSGDRFDVCFVIVMNGLLNKHLSGRWVDMPRRSCDCDMSTALPCFKLYVFEFRRCIITWRTCQVKLVICKYHIFRNTSESCRHLCQLGIEPIADGNSYDAQRHW